MKNICVVGGGRMGLPLAATFAHRGASVTVCDIDRDLVGVINPRSLARVVAAHEAHRLVQQHQQPIGKLERRTVERHLRGRHALARVVEHLASHPHPPRAAEGVGLLPAPVAER